MKLKQSWCPTCAEWTVIEAGRSCAWCDTTTVSRRGGWKRPDIQGRISRTAALSIHAKYTTGVSARTLGRELHQILGYPNPKAAEIAIGKAFRRHGLPVRERIEATVLASTKNGLSVRDWRERYRRRQAAGLSIHMQPLQPMCKGIREQYPRKGQPCRRPAARGSDYCISHDPARRADVRAHLERARSRSPKRPGSNRSETETFVPSP